MKIPDFLVFDIETVPDLELGRRLYSLPADLPDEDLVRAMLHVHEQKTGTRFLPPVQCRVVAIAGVCLQDGRLHLDSFAKADSPEKELVKNFFNFIDRRQPILVSWNGGGFDLPVLHYRALRYGVSSEYYWEVGENHTSYRYNNYQSRYHHRHLDLMDKLARYQLRAAAGLDQMAKLLGLPGKSDMDGSQVCDAWLAGKIDAIRDYCELDVINTYVVYLHFLLISRQVSEGVFHDGIQQLRETLSRSSKPHWQAFAKDWQDGGTSGLLNPA